jgi:ribonuclease P protein subunit POP4
MQRSGNDNTARVRVARGELIARRARVADSNDPTLVGIEGRIVDETKNTLTLQTGSTRQRVGKPGQQFAITDEDSTVLLDGSTIAHRPEGRIDRAKVDR